VRKKSDKLTNFILKKYAQMPGEEKVRLAMELSETVRQARKDGKTATGA
jgi:hypothetical protein